MQLQRLIRVVENLKTILAIELYTAAQALEFRRPAKSSAAVEKLVEAYRNHVSFVAEDRYMAIDIAASRAFLDGYELPDNLC
jgi:histidine ammonia-lyase